MAELVSRAPADDWPGDPSKDWPQEWFVPQAACLWCGAEDLSPILTGVRDWFFAAVPGEFTIHRCNRCASLLLDRRPDDDHIGRAYAAYYTHAATGGESGGSIARRAVRVAKRAYIDRRYGNGANLSARALSVLFERFPSRRLEADVRYRFLPRPPARVLDYGCGNGDFLARAAQLGHQVTGVDFDSEAVRAAVRRGLPALLPGDMGAVDLDGRFDLVTANHVIEHVADPHALLRQFSKWLRPGGRLFIEVPDAQARGIARHGRFWRGLEAPRHFSLPSRAALQDVLEETGFADLRFHERAFLAPEMDRLAREAQARCQDCAAGAPLPDGFQANEFITVTATVR